jgi:transcription elongation GreA/GreB family factor
MVTDCKVMSKAFTKEDVDPPERSGRVRSASGLPPGAVNYITARGAARLQRELDKLRRAGGNHSQRLAELERILSSVTIVEAPDEPTKSVAFGARVTVRDAAEQLRTYRIVGVDELELEVDAVSWISPIGRALLAADLGDQVTLEDVGPIKVVKIDYPTD